MPFARIPEERLREMFEELLEDSVYQKLQSGEQGKVEGMEDALRTLGKLTPFQVGFVCKLYRRVIGREP